jgi:hypothetical protein
VNWGTPQTESKTPADPGIGPLYERALRIRQVDADAKPGELATVLARYARWLRTSGRVADAAAMETRADALNHEIQTAEERSRAAMVSPRGISGTDIVVGEHCAQAGVSVLDRLNDEVAAEGAVQPVSSTHHAHRGQPRLDAQ